MAPRSFLPSAQFMVIVGSLLVSGGVVAAAQYYISAKNAPAALASAEQTASKQAWEESLADIQAQSGVNLPDSPDPNAVDTLISLSQSDNLTDSIGRGILARITTANVQGLGDDAPTQDSIIAAASAQVNASSKAVPPPAITEVEPTLDSQREFGNAVMAALNRHPKANSNDTLGIIAKATDTRISAPLSGLPAIGQEYAALARDLAAVPVPRTLTPLYKEAVANFAAIAALYPDMGKVVDDPIKGIAALQQYQSLLAETGGVFTNMAQSLKNGGILFTKDEPGSAWQIFLLRLLNAHHRLMPRKIIFIIVGALLFLALLALLWFWFLHRSPAADPGRPSGFATSSDRGQGGAAAGGQGNTPSNTQGGGAAGQNGGAAGQGIGGGIDITGGGIGTGGIGSGVNTGGSGVDMGGSGIDMGPGGSGPDSGSGSQTGTSTPPSGTNTGAWLGSSVSERIFNPSDIADLNDPGNLGGTPFISTTPQPASLGNSGLVLGLTAAGCLAQWAANQIVGTVATAADPATIGSAAIGVVTVDISAAKQRNETKSQTVMQCIVKSIAQAAIDQITRSVVNWINSGFNGQPSFVTNFNQYFANVADQAAGEFIKGSALSFLCSPFAPQIKIAIAQSYANRNSNGASCSLTKVTNNINGFLKGNWSAGGWGGLLQFTTIPTNNPYGAYAYAQIGLNSAVANAQGNANRNISPGGFISVQKCDNVPTVTVGTGAMQTHKNCKVTTPGQVIEDSLKASQNSSINQLNIAQDINSIINALTNQLVIKTLYGGLANANSGVTNPLAPAIDQAASAQAKELLAGLQASAGYAVQYGSAKQGSASDIQQVQQNFNTLYNCWQTAASSTALSAGQQAQGAQGAASANTQILQLQAQIDALNADITRANAAIASIQNLQSQVLFAATPADISTASYAIQAAGPSLMSQADVTTAQQNRAALQTQLTATNQLAQGGLSQCKAVLGA